MQEYKFDIKKILDLMPLAEDIIMRSKPQCCANSLFPKNRWGVINNNQAECWNGWMKQARFMPVVTMVDHIRKQIMNFMHDRREDSYAMVGEVCPKQQKKISLNYTTTRTLRIDRFGTWNFEVIENEKSYAVDFHAWTCSWRAWQIEKILCKHACVCIDSKGLSVYDYMDRYYKIDMYKKTYQPILNPIPTFDMDFWNEDYDDDDVINAPDVRSQAGRRRTQRIPSQVQTRVTKCKRCGITVALVNKQSSKPCCC
ncbi:PREDICTED: uncharacterized protein LOC105954572 [Erythranthe guttata]|uniref:uncharacterized protein LOC105954572 n=1 Tax=Erythranthe guttata TaxID=4155 RepID=UPI00064DBE37|nr:PREDICTED: uncharacterized protein LOC105954572 [Erythranthe guttata]|eukprot:XP_012833693.1 PREDICTED: uncharacterized protein LOC105954572 [Erythranthe guttata]